MSEAGYSQNWLGWYRNPGGGVSCVSSNAGTVSRADLHYLAGERDGWNPASQPGDLGVGWDAAPCILAHESNMWTATSCTWRRLYTHGLRVREERHAHQRDRLPQGGPGPRGSRWRLHYRPAWNSRPAVRDGLAARAGPVDLPPAVARRPATAAAGGGGARRARGVDDGGARPRGAAADDGPRCGHKLVKLRVSGGLFQLGWALFFFELFTSIIFSNIDNASMMTQRGMRPSKAAAAFIFTTR